MLSERSLTQKDKFCVISLTWGIQNSQTKSRIVLSRGWEWVQWEMLVKGSKLQLRGEYVLETSCSAW